MKYNLNWSDIFQRYISSSLPLKTFWQQYFAKEEKIPSYETLRVHMVAVRRTQQEEASASGATANAPALTASSDIPRQIGPGVCLACDHIAKRLKPPLTPVAIGMRRFLFSQKS